LLVPLDARRSVEPPSPATSTAVRTAPVTSSKWSITVSNTASWPLMPRVSASCAIPTSANRITPLPRRPRPQKYQYDFNLREIAEVWRRGGVIASWLLDLTAAALVKDPGLAQFQGRVSDPGEGRWTNKAVIDEGVPVPVLSTALYERF